MVPGVLADLLHRRGLEAEGVAQPLGDHAARRERLQVLGAEAGEPAPGGGPRDQLDRRGDVVDPQHHPVLAVEDLGDAPGVGHVEPGVGLGEPRDPALLVAQPDVGPEPEAQIPLRQGPHVAGLAPAPGEVVEVAGAILGQGHLHGERVQAHHHFGGDRPVDADHAVEVDLGAGGQHQAGRRFEAPVEDHLVTSRGDRRDPAAVPAHLPAVHGGRRSQRRGEHAPAGGGDLRGEGGLGEGAGPPPAVDGQTLPGYSRLQRRPGRPHLPGDALPRAQPRERPPATCPAASAWRSATPSRLMKVARKSQQPEGISLVSKLTSSRPIPRMTRR